MRTASTLLLLLSLTSFAAAQTGPVNTPADDPVDKTRMSAKEMFENAVKAGKPEPAKKGEVEPESEGARVDRAIKKQQEVAGRHAESLRSKEQLSGEEMYYLGLLEWLADRFEPAKGSLEAALAQKGLDEKQLQLARTVLVSISTKLKEFEAAERHLAAFLSSDPKPVNDRYRLHRDLASAYRNGGDTEMAALHAEKALEATQDLLKDSADDPGTMAKMLDAGTALFQLRRDNGEVELAVGALEAVRRGAIAANSPLYHFLAIDETIKFLLELGRRDEALGILGEALDSDLKKFEEDWVREDAQRRLISREAHYKMIGQPARKLDGSGVKLNNANPELTDHIGKVVLIDFWATWCGPCITAFPSIKAWQAEFGDELVILGVTRFFGRQEGKKLDKKGELEFVDKFVQKHGLTYGILISDDFRNSVTYDVNAIPTVVLIDRDGNVRQIEVGSSKTKLAKLGESIRKLVSEKSATTEAKRPSP